MTCGEPWSTRRLSGSAQLRSANQVVFVLVMTLFRAGYFLSMDKSVLRPVQLIKFLGIMVDSAAAMFRVPADQVKNLRHLIEDIWYSVPRSNPLSFT